MSDALQNAKARLAVLRAELRRAEQFIRDYATYEVGQGIAVKRKAAPRTAVEGQKDTVLANIVAVLEEASRPIKVKDIAEQIAAKGVVIIAKDARNYVGTIVHRNPDIIQRTKDGCTLRIPETSTIASDTIMNSIAGKP